MKTPEERFYEAVKKTDTCWLWIATKNKAGYGIIMVSSKRSMAHRYSWELFNGPIPDGMLVCHKCDNPPCVNPDHLFLGSAADNANDKIVKGRHKWGTTGRPRKEETRVHVSARLPRDVAEWLNENGVTETIERMARNEMKADVHFMNTTLTGKTLKEIKSQMNAMLSVDGPQGLTATTDTGAEIHVELYEGQDYIKTADGKIIK